MDELKEKHLRPCRKLTDQFIIASALTFLIVFVGAVIVPGNLLVGFFQRILGGDHDATVFLLDYFTFIGIWVVLFLVVIIPKDNRPMLQVATAKANEG